jgi:hypothetical protein
MTKTVYLKELIPVSILFEGDFHELASLMLRGLNAQYKGSNGTPRPTVHGVARAYASLFSNFDFRKIEAQLRKMGYDLGAMVEWDQGPAEACRSKL